MLPEWFLAFISLSQPPSDLLLVFSQLWESLGLFCSWPCPCLDSGFSASSLLLWDVFYLIHWNYLLGTCCLWDFLKWRLLIKSWLKKLLGIVKFLYISLSFYLLSLVFFWRWQHPFLIKTIRTGTTKDSAYILWKNLQNIYQTADKKHTRPLWQTAERKVILGDC